MRQEDTPGYQNTKYIVVVVVMIQNRTSVGKTRAKIQNSIADMKMEFLSVSHVLEETHPGTNTQTFNTSKSGEIGSKSENKWMERDASKLFLAGRKPQLYT